MCIWKVPGSDLSRETSYPVFRVSPKFLQANARIKLKIVARLPLSKSYLINDLLIILPSEVIGLLFELLTASLNEQYCSVYSRYYATTVR
jgi:hypothetical protein